MPDVALILIPMLLIFLRNEHRLTRLEMLINGGEKKK